MLFQNGSTPLALAAARRNDGVTMVSGLLSPRDPNDENSSWARGALYLRDDQDDTPLLVAAKHHNLHTTGFLLFVGGLDKLEEDKVQSFAAQLHHLHVSRTTQYLRHPSTLKAEIWCATPRSQNLLPQEISVQSDK